MCHAFSSGNDCTALETNASCSFLRTECLDEELNGACQVEERIYRCPTPGGAVSDAPQYICGADVYCINGDCEPIVREASTEFKNRKSVGEGKRVSVSVALGGRRII